MTIRPPRRGLALALVFGGVAVVGLPAALARSGTDRTHLPVGAISTAPGRGTLWSCQTSFPPGAGGAFREGPWMNGDGTWDATRKVTVDGAVAWPTASVRIVRSGSTRTITGNGLPKGHTTGVYPIASTDDAYQYDRNPNTIQAQKVALTLAASPTVATTPRCASNVVGITLTGVAIFSSIDGLGRDAQAYEIQDACGGHPERTGAYHYHGLPTCGDPTKQVGWALDGFAIWGPVDPERGVALRNADLDECHGTTSRITIDGKKVRAYHYVANDEYPYTVGCFRSTPTRVVADRGSGGQGAPGAPTPGGPGAPGPSGAAGQGSPPRPSGPPPGGPPPGGSASGGSPPAGALPGGPPPQPGGMGSTPGSAAPSR